MGKIIDTFSEQQMKKTAIILLVLLFSLCSFALKPIPGTNVHDFAHILGNTRELDRRIEALYSNTGVEMAVVTVPNTGNDSLEIYAVKLFEDWGIGKKGEDKGLLILLAAESRDWRVEVGYGLEGALPDSYVGLKFQQLAVSSLARNSSEGLIEFVADIENRIISQGDIAEDAHKTPWDFSYENVEVEQTNSTAPNPYGGLILFVLVVVAIVLDLRFTGGMFLGSLLSSSRRGHRGSGYGRGSSSGRSRYGGGGKSGGGGASGKW